MLGIKRMKLPFSQVVIPVRSRILDRNIVYFYNIAFFITLIIAIVIFLLGLKGLFDFTPVVAGANMWMNGLDESTINASAIPIYCDNPDYNYFYGPSFKYFGLNNSCIDGSVKESFTKGIILGTYWTTTYENTITLKKKQCNVSTQICNGISESVSAQNFFIKHIEEYPLVAQIDATVPSLGLDGRSKDVEMPIVFQMPNGTKIQIPQSNGKLLIKLKIGKWLTYFGIENLDSVGDPLRYDVEGSKGKRPYRLSGLSLIFSVEIRNTKHEWDYPGPVYILVKLSVVEDWARVTFRPKPTANLGESLAVDHYGIRWVWKPLPTKVYVFSWEKGFLSVLNVVIFFTIMDHVVYIAVLYCCKDSKHWRNAVSPEMHYFEEMEEVVKLHEHDMKDLKTTNDSKKSSKIGSQNDSNKANYDESIEEEKHKSIGTIKSNAYVYTEDSGDGSDDDGSTTML